MFFDKGLFVGEAPSDFVPQVQCTVHKRTAVHGAQAMKNIGKMTSESFAEMVSCFYVKETFLCPEVCIVIGIDGREKSGIGENDSVMPVRIMRNKNVYSAGF